MPIPETAHRISADAYLFGLAPAYGRIARLEEPQAMYRVHDRNHYHRKPFKQRLRTGLGNRRQQWRVLEAYCRSLGVAADRSSWERNCYFHRVHASLGEIERYVPAGEPFILVDEDAWGSDDIISGRPRIPFMERDGWYNGRPEDDDAAIAELERLRGHRGAAWLVLAWPAFWWLEHYAEFAAYLHASYACVARTERLAVFDLHPRAGDGASAGAPARGPHR